MGKPNIRWVPGIGYTVISKTRMIASGVDEHGELHQLWSDRNGIVTSKPRSEYCEICDRKCDTVFDHCHATEVFRGWICRQCNSILGLAGDDVNTLHKCAAYLQCFAAGREQHAQAQSDDYAAACLTTPQGLAIPTQNEYSDQS